MAKPTIKAICFDMDGLLFNTEELFDQVGNEMLASRGRELDYDLVKRMMGQQANVALQMFIDHYDLDDSVADLQSETDVIFARLLPERLAPMPGAVEILKRLSEQGDRPLALTTSSSLPSVDRIMQICDLRSHFSFELTAEDIARGKPEPEIYLTAAEKFEIQPDEMLVFEDSENGCKSGVAAGAHVIAIPSKHGNLHSFDGSLFVADSLQDQRIAELLF